MAKHLLGDVGVGATFVPAPALINPGLGPLFNNNSCISCHQRDGRGRPPLEGEQLNTMLFTTERLDNFVGAHEVLDLNRYKIINNPVKIKKLIRQNKIATPFVFFSNKN